MKGNWTLQNRELMCKGHVEEMAVELQVNARIKQIHDSLQRFSANDFVCRTHVSERALPKMFAFQELTSEEVSVVHEGRQLSLVGAQLLHDAGAVDDFGMRQVSGKLVEVERTEGTVAFTQGHVSSVFVAKRLFETAKNATPISRPGFVDYGGPGFAGVFLSVVAGIVADDNHPPDQGMGLKILHGFKNRFLVVIRGEHHGKAVEWKIVFFRAA